MLKGRVEGKVFWIVRNYWSTWGDIVAEIYPSLLKRTTPPYWAQQDDGTQYLPEDPSKTIPGILDHLLLDEIPDTRDREALGALDCLNAGVWFLDEKKATSVLVKEVNHRNME